MFIFGLITGSLIGSTVGVILMALFISPKITTRNKNIEVIEICEKCGERVDMQPSCFCKLGGENDHDYQIKWQRGKRAEMRILDENFDLQNLEYQSIWKNENEV